MKKTAFLSTSIISILIFTLSLAVADTKTLDFSSTGADPCSITINQDLSFTIPNASYDGGPLVGQMALKIDFQFFGEQNGQLMWKLGNIGTSSSSCSVTIDPDLSFTLANAIYDGGPLVGQIAFQADFQYFGEQNGALLWFLADLQVDNTPSDPTPDPSTTDCGAYVAPGVWKEFDCYNLAAIGKTTGDDPFTPSWRLIGGYWQWGRKGPDPSQWYDTNTEHFAHGPTGPDYSEANNGFINWDNDNALKGAWSDSVKTSNDPCPAGYRVPTQSQWGGVIDNNTRSSVGSWDRGDTNYSSALYFGDNLLLPAAGLRHPDLGGDLVNSRGFSGYYWSSTESTPRYSHSLSFYWDGIGTAPNYRGYGFSVRCIAE